MNVLVMIKHLSMMNYFDRAKSGRDDRIKNPVNTMRIRLIADAGTAMFVLLATTTISVYKPWGKIQLGFGVPKFIATTKKPLGIYLLIGFAAVLILFIILHVVNGGMHD